ncbi:redox-regulated ATPase YchF [bacterium]|nr:redox-regulated ATPase YchF [bacterium]
MGFKCGLVGLPNAGKSTVFNALTRLGVEASAYPFCTIDPHFGVVPIQDERLDFVMKVAGSPKKTPTLLEFVDIAGLVKGASQGEGLGNQFLSHIQRVDAVAHVVRCFKDANVSHPYQTLDPVRDAEIVETEILLKDLDTLQRNLSKVRAAARSGNTEMLKKLALLESIGEILNRARFPLPALHEDQKQAAAELNLLSFKPVLFIANLGEQADPGDPLGKKLEGFAASHAALCIPFYGKVQAEIAELPSGDQGDFLSAMGVAENGVQTLIQAGYAVLRLITFYTANETEAHAWTVQDGTHAVQAAGRVHSDFEAHFIKAEVVPYKLLQEFGSLKELHDRGLIQIHGRDYPVKDGDLIVFRVRK